MDLGNKKATVPNPSVAADGEQPILNCSDVSISETPGEINSQMEMLWEPRKPYDPDRLHTVSMTELYENVYESRPAIIKGILYPGTYLFVGPPKVERSFLMAQIAYHVSTGLPSGRILSDRVQCYIWLWRTTSDGSKASSIVCLVQRKRRNSTSPSVPSS